MANAKPNSMPSVISIRVTGKPVPKGRPRFTRYGGVFTPATTVEYENRVAATWTETYGDMALNGQLEAFLYFGTVNHHKQDIDNLAKSALDGLQKAGAFVNGDEQVYKITASKYPATRDDQHTIIVLREYDYADTA